MPTTPRLFVLNAPDIAGDAANMRIAVFDATGTTLVASTASGIVATASGYTATVAYDAAWSTTGVVRWSHLGAEVAAEAYDVPTGSGGGSSAPTVVQIRQELDANSAKLANLDATVSSRLATSGYVAPTNADTSGVTTLLGRVTGAVALASQIPANFTTATFASAGVFATAALANAPAGGGSSGDSSGVTTLLARLTAPRAALLDVLGTGVPLNLNQAGIAARALDDVTTASLTVGDCLVAAASGATGKEVTSGLSYQIKTPTGDLTLRNFVLDNAKSPTRRD